ncbi:MAG: PQQ-binding-like beta-propeller repeat protein [Verrucomicrobiota bacterium]
MKYEALLPNAKQIWSRPAPAAANGGAILFGSSIAILGSAEVEARDLATGEVKWSTYTRAHQLFPISDTLVGARGRKKRQGIWEAYNTEDGEVQWTRTFDDWPPESPWVCGDEAWILTLREERALTSLKAFDTRTGDNLDSVIAPFALAAGVSIESFWTSRDISDSIGRGLMRYDRKIAAWDTLSRDPHELCVVDSTGAIVKQIDSEIRKSGHVESYNHKDREPKWKTPFDGPVHIDGDLIFVVYDEKLKGVDRETGKEKWNTPLPADRQLLEPRSFGRRALVRFREGESNIIDTTDGTVVGKTKDDPSALVSGKFVVTIDDKEVTGFSVM